MILLLANVAGSSDELNLEPKRNKNTNQLLDEFEHDIMNYQNRGLCYPPKPTAEADNTDTTF